MLKQRMRWMPVLGIVFAVLLVLSACGNNDKGTGSANGSGTASESASGSTGSTGDSTTGSSSGSENGAAPEEKTPETTETEANVPDPDASHPIVTIEMEDGGVIKAELYPEVAPNTVNNFISLIKQGFYDGTGFHRVIPGFMIQGGDPDGNGTGGPGYSIPGEFTANGFQNDLKHTTGVLSMARTEDPNSAGSQFFIMVADAPHLDQLYASFGKVIEGMDVAMGIVNVETNGETPVKMPIMKKVTVDTLGKDYPEPEKQS
ncbi:peptidylprolyl isomerase [Paenibacillus sp. FSL R5-0810]|uniref:peptidylprolyl isomerase n=1 Tax=Paenibacillus sp. FSL R5-0810 TaxID=2921659 RepID=UPI0030F6369F